MLDKELYRLTYEQWQGWSEAAEKDRLVAAAQLSSGERWRQFQALVEFSRNIQPELSPHKQRAEKLAAVDRYYEAVRRLEDWRRQHGRST